MTISPNYSSMSLPRHLEPIEALRPGVVIIGGERLVNFASNDYLGLAHHPALIKAGIEAMDRWGAGAGASRLMSGDMEIHHELERAVAFLKGKEAALIFGSGYLANTGTIPAICGHGDAIFSDRLNHASIIDGIILSGARFFRFRHNDLESLEALLRENRNKYKNILILVESLYSMEGDEAMIRELIDTKERYGAMLMVDEAHAVGVFGDNGEGLIDSSLADGVDLIIGTFGKALGGYGAFVAVSKTLKNFLVNKARTFIFSTALPPPVVSSNIAAIKLLASEKKRREKVLKNSAHMRARLKRQLGINPAGRSQIVPVIVGEDKSAVALADHLRALGFFVKAVRPPTVPEGSSRIRLSITADHGPRDIDMLLEALADGFSYYGKGIC